MRGILFVCTLIFCLVACKKDPVSPNPKPVDSLVKPIDSAKKPIDTTKPPPDTTKKPVDTGFVETAAPLLLPVNDSINSDIGGYYVALPTHYLTSGKKYPLLFFTSGAGVYGDGNKDLPLMLKEALQLLLK